MCTYLDIYVTHVYLIVAEFEFNDKIQWMIDVR